MNALSPRFGKLSPFFIAGGLNGFSFESASADWLKCLFLDVQCRVEASSLFLGGLLKQFRLDLKSKGLVQQRVGGKPRKVWFLL